MARREVERGQRDRGAPRASRKGAVRGLPAGIRIVHEDDDLIVIDKPAGLLTAGLPGQDVESVFRHIKVRVREQRKRRGTQVWIIHRLDKEASGLLVFAKTERAYAFLKEEFRTKRAHRLYAAVVEGEIGEAGTQASRHTSTLEKSGGVRARMTQPLSGTIQNFLVEDEQGLVRSVATPTAVKARGGGTDAKLAVTHWRVAAVGNGRTLLQVRLETGRKNQIRVHMAGMSHPIVGDRRYGAATDPIGRVCLHATELGFGHPASGQTMRFNSPMPREFRGLVGSGADVPGPEVVTPDPADKPAASGAEARVEAAAEPPRRDAIARKGDTTSWDHVAEWYTDLIEERRSDHHELVILPGTTRLLDVKAGMRVLDVACGQGILARRLARMGAEVVGVDASPKLIEAATRAAASDIPSPRFVVGDARELGKTEPGEFDGAACVMALMNIEPMGPVLGGVAAHLKTGGRFVAVILHPAFRGPGQTSWGWDQERAQREESGGFQKGHAGGAGPRGVGDGRPGKPRGGRAGFGERGGARGTAAPAVAVKQYRRVDGYLSPGQAPIVMNPGGAAHGREAITTMTFHRPIQAYVNAFAKAGLLVDAMEEWPSLRSSQPGPRAAEENRARREIPMFLAMRGVKTTGG
jgi:23S rRNA-/tRNA-specific pseudouridylate synthase/SAM-dependent methyltransferase